MRMEPGITITPDYYDSFHCIAGACSHTCCAGWEVDIDSESLARYKRDGIPFISEEETPHFILKEGERCPFLNGQNLCELILSHGEDYLCQICTDHPRFRNFWTGITEVGLGLSCEEAARLVLSRPEPVKLVLSGTGETIEEAISNLPADEQYLWNVREDLFREAETLENPWEARLAEYLIYRQIPDALYDDRLEGRIRFVWESVREIRARFANRNEQTFASYVDTVRAYSAEIEYNPERLEALLEQYEND